MHTFYTILNRFLSSLSLSLSHREQPCTARPVVRAVRDGHGRPREAVLVRVVVAAAADLQPQLVPQPRHPRLPREEDEGYARGALEPQWHGGVQEPARGP